MYECILFLKPLNPWCKSLGEKKKNHFKAKNLRDCLVLTRDGLGPGVEQLRLDASLEKDLCEYILMYEYIHI